MESETLTVQKLFQDRRQYRVPFFQRPYVWNKEDQWERLASDIIIKAEMRAGGEEPPPPLPRRCGTGAAEACGPHGR